MSRRARNYCFTLNNYTEDNIEELLEEVGPNDLISYIIFQEEIAPGTGTKHLQGYMELTKAKSMRALKTSLAMPAIHLEVRGGSQRQAIDYCKKADSRAPDGEQWEAGRPKRLPGNGAISLIISGATMREVAEEFPNEYVRHHQGFMALKLIRAEKRDWAMDVHIYFGATGTGKSYKAYHDYPGAYTVPWPSKRGTWWWPHYEGQETVILDEFRHQISFTIMLQLLDRYSFKVQAKGSHHEFNSKRLVFTTNIDPYEWYPKVQDREPFMRRLRDFATIHDFSELEYDDDNETPIPQIEIRDKTGMM